MAGLGGQIPVRPTAEPKGATSSSTTHQHGVDDGMITWLAESAPSVLPTVMVALVVAKVLVAAAVVVVVVVLGELAGSRRSARPGRCQLGGGEPAHGAGQD